MSNTTPPSTTAKVPVRIVPPEVDHMNREGEKKVFSKRQLNFLKAYSGCMDEDQAAIEAGIEKKHISDLISEPHVKAQMEKIQKTWGFGVLLTAGHAAAKHMELMDKFETHYDNDERKEDQSKMAGVLAKMSEAALKATGLIGQNHEVTIPTIIMNLNTTGETTVQTIVQAPAIQGEAGK